MKKVTILIVALAGGSIFFAMYYINSPTKMQDLLGGIKGGDQLQEKDVFIRINRSGRSVFGKRYMLEFFGAGGVEINVSDISWEHPNVHVIKISWDPSTYYKHRVICPDNLKFLMRE